MVGFSCVSISPGIPGVFCLKINKPPEPETPKLQQVAVGFLHALPSSSRFEGYVRSACSELKTWW